MLKSMTGFGLATKDYNALKISAEIKTLNSKFIDISVKLPRAYMNQEMYCRAECQKLLERGKISISVTIESGRENLNRIASIDRHLLKAYFKELQEISEELGYTEPNLLGLALNLPQVVKENEQLEKENANEEEWEQIYDTFKQALVQLDAFRIQEGRVLQMDIQNRIALILDMLDYIEANDSKRIPAIKEKLSSAIESKVGGANFDKNRLEQELIYYFEKLDITEEKTRLRNHCNYFMEILESEEASGKKLNFVSMEIGREINTIGSKVGDATIQQKVILMKDELEKIKEQLLNIL